MELIILLCAWTILLGPALAMALFILDDIYGFSGPIYTWLIFFMAGPGAWIIWPLCMGIDAIRDRRRGY
jgi:hypothetical protein